MVAALNLSSPATTGPRTPPSLWRCPLACFLSTHHGQSILPPHSPASRHSDQPQGEAVGRRAQSALCPASDLGYRFYEWWRCREIGCPVVRGETRQTGQGLLFLLSPEALCVGAKWLQPCTIFVTPWRVARQAPLSIGFSRQKYCGLSLPAWEHREHGT